MGLVHKKFLRQAPPQNKTHTHTHKKKGRPMTPATATATAPRTRRTPNTIDFYFDRTNPRAYTVRYSYDAETDILRLTFHPRFFGPTQTEEAPNFSPVYYRWFISTDGPEAIHADPTEATEAELSLSYNFGVCLGYF